MTRLFARLTAARRRRRALACPKRGELIDVTYSGSDPILTALAVHFGEW